MKIAQINMVPYGSTGKIMLQIAEMAKKRGHEVASFTTELFCVKGRRERIKNANLYYYGSFGENGIHNYLGKLLGANGLFSYFGTVQLIKMIKVFSPDIIHLHNLHGHCLNLPLLFRYIKKSNARAVWTLHDCWSFTGHCAYFDMSGCERWKTGCHHCASLMDYPKSFMDTTKWMYKSKKKWFNGIKNMTIVTPSQWLADLVKQSFLKEYPIKVINNGIDLDVFKPCDSDFRRRHNVENKFVILGVAFDWGKRKGLDVFEKLANMLDENYQIVIVGTDKNIDQNLPDNIISIHQTANQTELAEIYSAADLLVNPTREDNFPTVNIESLACGTPVVTFKTGGSPEIIDGNCGSIVEKNDINGLQREIIRICDERPYTKQNCLARAKQFDKYDKFKTYVELYESEDMISK